MKKHVNKSAKNVAGRNIADENVGGGNAQHKNVGAKSSTAKSVMAKERKPPNTSSPRKAQRRSEVNVQSHGSHSPQEQNGAFREDGEKKLSSLVSSLTPDISHDSYDLLSADAPQPDIFTSDIPRPDTPCILGIDPGSLRCGWAVVSLGNSAMAPFCFKTPSIVRCQGDILHEGSLRTLGIAKPWRLQGCGVLVPCVEASDSPEKKRTEPTMGLSRANAQWAKALKTLKAPKETSGPMASRLHQLVRCQGDILHEGSLRILGIAKLKSALMLWLGPCKRVMLMSFK